MPGPTFALMWRGQKLIDQNGHGFRTREECLRVDLDTQQLISGPGLVEPIACRVPTL